MPAQIETSRFCATYWADFTIEGSKGASYTVSLDGGEGPVHCTCPAFAYAPPAAKDCKHIRRVWEEACLWNPQWRDTCGTTLKPTKYHAPNLLLEPCPACGGPTVAVRIAV